MKKELIIVGAGGCGLTAALVAAEQGMSVVILEAADHVGGSTAMSAGIFVAANSRLQQATGELGSAEALAADIHHFNQGQSDPAVTLALCHASGPLMDWLVDRGVPLELMAGYRYDGMGHDWMIAPPSRHGADIVQALATRVAEEPKIELLTQTKVTGLRVSGGNVSGGNVTGVDATRSDGTDLSVTANAVILGAAGFGANRALVAQHLPDLANAPYYGTPHATGEAIQWAQALGAATDHMTAHQSHSSIAVPDLMLVTTYLINQGAIQVNRRGQRFGNEVETYAGHAVAVQAQPGGTVIELFDERILEQTLANYPRFAECVDAGIVHRADSIDELASTFDLDAASLTQTLNDYNASHTDGTFAAGADPFGRTQFGAVLNPPFYGIQVTSALIQTLGGLRVDEDARVLRANGDPIVGLYAGGGTAAGLAGDHTEGYLAGTGLLAAFGLGWIAGRHVGK